MTGFVNISIVRKSPDAAFCMIKDGRCVKIAAADVLAEADNKFCFRSEFDNALLNKIKLQKKYDLSSAVFALGIVTGDNRHKVFNSIGEDREAVYTGKEVGRYILKKPQKYLHYDRMQLQQTAPDEYYRAGEKLVYKFISKDLVFAYDNTGSLLLNSANMLIPQIPQLSMKTVLALLNSTVLRYYYRMMFADVKILKGNLMQLPLPEVEYSAQAAIDTAVDELLQGNQAAAKTLQKLTDSCWDLSAEEASYIKQQIQ